MAAAAAASVTGAGETTAAAMSGLPAAPAESIDLTAIGWDEQSMNEVVEDIGPVRSWLWTTYVCSSYCAFSLVLVSAGSATFFYPQGGLAQPAHQVAQAEFRWLLAAGYW